MSSVPAGFNSPLVGTIQLDTLLGRGKEGVTYSISGNSLLVAKIYHSPPGPKTIRKLEIMISNPPIPTAQGGHRPPLAWPLSLIYDDKRVVRGFLMQIVEPTWSLDSLFFPERRAKLRTANGEPIGWHHLHVIARNLARTVSACHDSGYVIGDLNNKNVQVYSDGRIALIDTDSFQVIDKSQIPPVVHHCEVIFSEYASPELIGQNLKNYDRTPASDNYVLATLIFKLLQDGMHPFAAATPTDPPLDPSQIMQLRVFPYSRMASGTIVTPYPRAPTFGRLHPQLRTLFLQTFTSGLDDPLRRASADQWANALAMARVDLRKCARGHYFVGQPNGTCLQLVSVKGGGYCGSTEQFRSLTPLSFQSIDSISGKSLTVGSNTPRSAPHIDLSVPPLFSPPPPPPPPAPANKMSRGDKVKAYVWGATILILLLLAISLGINGESKSDSTVVASSVQSPTAIPKRPTTVATQAPATAPVLETMKAPSPTPTATVGEETDRSRPTDVADPTVPFPLPEIATLANVLSQARSSDAIIFSSHTADGWELTIAIPANGVQASLQKGVPTDPAPALSPEGDRIAYLDSAPTGHVIWIFNLRNGSNKDFPLPESKGVPLNLAWKSSDTILVTSLLGDEPRIYQFDLGSGDTEDFLPPWSANPSVSLGGEMVYVVPYRNDPDNLGIVPADNDGDAKGRPFVLDATSNENFPSLDPGNELVAYTISEGDDRTHTLGISRHSDDDSFTSIPLQNSFLSSTPIRTFWVDSDRLVVGTCIEGSCEIILFSLSSPAQRTLIKSTEAISLGNIVYRSA